jgi:multicomponent Na+:H+ antiporter subunit D
VLSLVVLLGTATVLVGEVLAFSQMSLRRTLAYSSIAQSGLAIFLVGIGSVEAITGSIMLLINNALSKFTLFSVDDKVIDEVGRDDRDTLNGFGRKSPIVGVIFVVSAFSIAGMPLFFGFRGKLNAISASFETSMAVPVIILIAAAIEVTYYFRWIFTFFKPVGTAQTSEKRMVPSVEFLAFGLVLSTVIVFLGVSSGEAFMMFERAADSLVNGILAIGKAILGGM